MMISAQNITECALGRLKARWRILQQQIDLPVDKLFNVIYACFVLYIFCEAQKSKFNPGNWKNSCKKKEVKNQNKKNGTPTIRSKRKGVDQPLQAFSKSTFDFDRGFHEPYMAALAEKLS